LFVYLGTHLPTNGGHGEYLMRYCKKIAIK
jgi:hypothetical protein